MGKGVLNISERWTVWRPYRNKRACGDYITKGQDRLAMKSEGERN
jgi:hypothetical protein